MARPSSFFLRGDRNPIGGHRASRSQNQDTFRELIVNSIPKFGIEFAQSLSRRITNTRTLMISEFQSQFAKVVWRTTQLKQMVQATKGRISKPVSERVVVPKFQ